MNASIVISVLAALIWLVPTILLCLWMARDFERRIGRPARTIRAERAARYLSEIVNGLKEQPTEFRLDALSAADLANPHIRAALSDIANN